MKITMKYVSGIALALGLINSYAQYPAGMYLQCPASITCQQNLCYVSPSQNPSGIWPSSIPNQDFGNQVFNFYAAYWNQTNLDIGCTYTNNAFPAPNATLNIASQGLGPFQESVKDQWKDGVPGMYCLSSNVLFCQFWVPDAKK